MRILYVATHIPFPQESGGTSHIRAVTRELLHRGHEIVLCANAGDGLEEGEVEGMQTYRFTWRYRDIGASQSAHRWGHGLRLARLAKRYDVDLIYERESSMGSVHFVPFVEAVYWLKRVGYTGWQSRSHIPEEFHGKTVWVHGAVDAEEFNDVTPMPIEGLDGRRGVAYTGSMLAWHGIPDLARALPAVLERVPETSLVIAGAATSEAQRGVMGSLKEAAEVAGAPDAVVTLGRVSHQDVPRVLAACEICVAPYNPAGEPDLERYGFWYSPMKLWEYMAAGRAVVSTDLPSIREIIGDDRGVLVPPGDAAALADAIAGLLEDDESRNAMGQRGLAFAKENTWERRVDEYERALEEALEGGK